jgi:hypothetical protein
MTLLEKAQSQFPKEVLDQVPEYQRVQTLISDPRNAYPFGSAKLGITARLSETAEKVQNALIQGTAAGEVEVPEGYADLGNKTAAVQNVDPQWYLKGGEPIKGSGEGIFTLEKKTVPQAQTLDQAHEIMVHGKPNDPDYEFRGLKKAYEDFALYVGEEIRTQTNRGLNKEQQKAIARMWIKGLSTPALIGARDAFVAKVPWAKKLIEEMKADGGLGVIRSAPTKESPLETFTRETQGGPAPAAPLPAAVTETQRFLQLGDQLEALVKAGLTPEEDERLLEEASKAMASATPAERGRMVILLRRLGYVGTAERAANE